MEEEQVGSGIAKEINNGRTMEDNIYWSNFKSMRFFISLSADFLSQLMIPDKFSENMREKLPQMAALKSPGGHAWDVQIVKAENGTIFFKNGWKEFANAHHFKENDLLMFKYNRDSCFKVWVFDKESSCENASSYFVRKSNLKEHVDGGSSQTKKKNTEGSFEIFNVRKSNLKEHVDGGSSQTKRKNTEGSFEFFNNAPYKKEVPNNEKASNHAVLGFECPPTSTKKKKIRRDSVNGSGKRAEGGTGTPTTPYTPNTRSQRAPGLGITGSALNSLLAVLNGGHLGQSSQLVSERQRQHFEETFSVFKWKGRPTGQKAKTRWLVEPVERNAAHLHVLLNCREVKPYLNVFKRNVRQRLPDATREEVDKYVASDFPTWFKSEVALPCYSGRDNQNYMIRLSRGPETHTKSYPGYVVDGVKFQAKRKSDGLQTYGAGIVLKGKGEGDDVTRNFYGVLEEVLCIKYEGYPVMECMLFKCHWFDRTVMGVQPHKNYPYASINHTKEYSKYDPFIFADTASQVMYVNYPPDAHGKKDWWVATPHKKRWKSSIDTMFDKEAIMDPTHVTKDQHAVVVDETELPEDATDTLPSRELEERDLEEVKEQQKVNEMIPASFDCGDGDNGVNDACRDEDVADDNNDDI